MKKRIASLFMAFVMLFSLCVPAALADTVEEEKLIDEVEEDRVARFTDVPADYTFYNDIYAVAGRGLFRGTTPTTFAPYRPMNRAMFVVVMSRLEGLEVEHVVTETGFRDVPSDYWAAGAIRWAVDAGIVTGYSDNSFHPAEAITRGQIAALVYRYITYKGYDQGEKRVKEVDPIPPQFPDVNQNTSHYAALNYCREHGLIRGFGDGTYRPYNDVTRAQVAAILNRIILIIEQIDGLSVTILPLTASNPHGAVPTYKVTRMENGVEVNASVIRKGDKVTINHTPQNDNYYATVKLYRDADKKQPIGIKEVPITMAKDGNSSYFYMPDYSVWVEVAYERYGGGGGGSGTTGGGTYYAVTVEKVALNAAGTAVDTSVSLNLGQVTFDYGNPVSSTAFSIATRAVSLARNVPLVRLTYPNAIFKNGVWYVFSSITGAAVGASSYNAAVTEDADNDGTDDVVGQFTTLLGGSVTAAMTITINYAPAVGVGGTPVFITGAGGATGTGDLGAQTNGVANLLRQVRSGLWVNLNAAEDGDEEPVAPGSLIRIQHQPNPDYHAVIKIEKLDADGNVIGAYYLTRDADGFLTLEDDASNGGVQELNIPRSAEDGENNSYFSMPDSPVKVRVWFESDVPPTPRVEKDLDVELEVIGRGAASLRYGLNDAALANLLNVPNAGKASAKITAFTDDTLKLVVTAEPDPGYTVRYVTVNDEELEEENGTYTCTFDNLADIDSCKVVVEFIEKTLIAELNLTLKVSGGPGAAAVYRGNNPSSGDSLVSVTTEDAAEKSEEKSIYGFSKNEGTVTLTIRARGSGTEDGASDTYWVASVKVTNAETGEYETLSPPSAKPNTAFLNGVNLDRVETYVFRFDPADLFDKADGLPKTGSGYTVEVEFDTFRYYFAANYDDSIFNYFTVPDYANSIIKKNDGLYVGKNGGKSVGKVPGSTPLVDVLMAFDEESATKAEAVNTSGEAVLDDNRDDDADNRTLINTAGGIFLNQIVTPTDGKSVKEVSVPLPGEELEKQIKGSRKDIKESILSTMSETVGDLIKELMKNNVAKEVENKKSGITSQITSAKAQVTDLNDKLDDLKSMNQFISTDTRTDAAHNGRKYSFAGDWSPDWGSQKGITADDIQFTTTPPHGTIDPFLGSADADDDWDVMTDAEVADALIKDVTDMIQANLFVPGIYPEVGVDKCPPAFRQYAEENLKVIDNDEGDNDDLIDRLLNAMLTNEDGKEIAATATIKQIDGETKLEIAIADVENLNTEIENMVVGSLTVALDLSPLDDIASRIYWRVDPAAVDALIEQSKDPQSNSKGFDEFLQYLENDATIQAEYDDLHDAASDARANEIKAIKDGLAVDDDELRSTANSLNSFVGKTTLPDEIRSIATDLDSKVSEIGDKTAGLSIDVDTSPLEEASEALPSLANVKTAVDDAVKKADAVLTAINGVKSSATSATDSIKSAATSLESAMTDLQDANDVLNGAGGVIANLDNTTTALNGEDWTAASTALTSATRPLTQAASEDGQKLRDSLANAATPINAAADSIASVRDDKLPAMETSLTNAEKAIDDLDTAITDAVNAIDTALTEVGGKIDEVVEKAEASDEDDALTKLQDTMDTLAAFPGGTETDEYKSAQEAKESLEAAIDARKTLNDNKNDLTPVQTQLSDAKTSLGAAKTNLSDSRSTINSYTSDLNSAKNLGNASSGLAFMGSTLTSYIPRINALDDSGEGTYEEKLAAYKEGKEQQYYSRYKEPVEYEGVNIYRVDPNRPFGGDTPAINWNKEILRFLSAILPKQNIPNPVSVQDQMDTVKDELNSALVEQGFTDVSAEVGINARAMDYPVPHLDFVEGGNGTDPVTGNMKIDSSKVTDQISAFVDKLNLSEMFLTERFKGQVLKDADGNVLKDEDGNIEYSGGYEAKLMEALYEVLNETAFPTAYPYLKALYNSAAYPGNEDAFIVVKEDTDGNVTGADIYYEEHPSEDHPYDEFTGVKKTIEAAKLDMNKVVIFTGDGDFTEWHDIYDYAIHLGNELRNKINADFDTFSRDRVAGWTVILDGVVSKPGIPARIRNTIKRFTNNGDNLETLAEVLAIDVPTAEDLYVSLMPDHDLGDDSTGYYAEKSFTWNFNANGGLYRTMVNEILKSAINISEDELTVAGSGTLGRVRNNPPAKN